MSTVITHSEKFGLPAIIINAPTCTTTIVNTNIDCHLVEIHGDPKTPFIIGVRFTNCTIVADNLRAFSQCYFDDSCTMVVDSLPRCGVESINKNMVIISDSDN